MTGTRHAYPMWKSGAAGEDDDRFLHDGRTRSTSIPFSLRRNFQPVPPKIISAGTFLQPFIPLDIDFTLSFDRLRTNARTVIPRANFARGICFFSAAPASSRDGKSICKTSRVAAS